jgi:N-acetylglutamate synthase and related acetyltransferases
MSNDADRDRLRISDDPAELDRARIHRWLSEQSYWAQGRPAETQDAAIDGSWNFGAYDVESGEQVGFARVVSDRATFAWLCDVFVDEGARGRGVGKHLVARITEELDALGIRRAFLATRDAHGLYAQYGFAPLQDPSLYLARLLPPPED